MKYLKALLFAIYCFIMLNSIVPNYIIIGLAAIACLIAFIPHSHSNQDIDYIAYNSNLYNINPFIKSIFFSGTLILCVATENYLFNAGIIVFMAIVSIILGKVKANQYIHLLTMPLLFIILSTLTIAIDFNNGISINRAGQIQGLKLVFKALASVSCLYGLALSTPVADIIEVLKKCKIPNLIIELMFLIYRFIFVLSDIVHNMQKATRARYGYSTYKKSIYSYGLIAQNLLIYSIKNINNYYNSILSRGYDEGISFYCEYSNIRSIEVILCSIYFVIIGVLCLM